MTNIPDLSIPNIDALDNDDLNNITEVFANLADYCVCLQVAKRFRSQGNINGAIEFEKSCDEIYNLLPDNVKW